MRKIDEILQINQIHYPDDKTVHQLMISTAAGWREVSRYETMIAAREAKLLIANAILRQARDAIEDVQKELANGSEDNRPA